MDKNNFFKRSPYEPQEASWCRICIRRNTCQDKAVVAMEERMVSPYPIKHLEISVKCRLYVKDIKLPPGPKDILEAMFIK